MAALVIIIGGALGRRIELAPGGTLIGRANTCDAILDHASVSKRHTRITSSPEGWVVEDVASTGGTFINDARVKGPTLLHASDYLKIGSVILRLV
jgi:pSer/pThr/pTyr-binding forkhead associated (FHA) protein